MDGQRLLVERDGAAGTFANVARNRRRPKIKRLRSTAQEAWCIDNEDSILIGMQQLVELLGAVRCGPRVTVKSVRHNSTTAPHLALVHHHLDDGEPGTAGCAPNWASRCRAC